MLRKEINWNHIKCLFTTRKGRKREVKNETKSKYNEQKIIINMVDVNSTMSIIVLSVDGLNIQIKRPIDRLSNH